MKKSQPAKFPFSKLFIFSSSICTRFDSICIPFLKFSIIELENGLVVVKGNGRGGDERKMGVAIKSNLRHLRGDGYFLYLNLLTISGLVVIPFNSFAAC